VIAGHGHQLSLLAEFDSPREPRLANAQDQGAAHGVHPAGAVQREAGGNPALCPQL
jgi:hypothetical protein